ncbi:MAG TPA: hypothetical protein VMT49_09190 [Steroidobacteraceae bacterium]|nr:hypothetical protein [Steroidobacteraceae bacterium]
MHGCGQGTRGPAAAASADDARFLAALEDCSLPPDQFDHAAHVRAGYLYLRQAPFPQATASMCAAITRYAGALGQPGRYHETVTVAFMALINEQVRHDDAADSWERFRARHPQLLRRDALLAYYPRAVLDSAAARRCFMLPPPAG